MSFTNSLANRLSPEAGQTLLGLARQSIVHGLAHERPLAVTLSDYPAPLTVNRASFVTLHRYGRLRGCIGSLEARRALVADVAENAFAAAFRDPRFPPLGQDEYPHITVDISILTPAQPVAIGSEADLLQAVRPGIDGLILQEGARRGTFLPAVWATLPKPADFIRQLKVKAGLPPDHWSDHIKVWRYQTEKIEE